MTGDSLPDEDDPGVSAAALDEELDEEDEEEEEEEEDEAMELMVSKTPQCSSVKTRHKPLLVRTRLPMNAHARPALTFGLATTFHAPCDLALELVGELCL
jgi:hypothetical protein